jgi:hypothetical protein
MIQPPSTLALYPDLPVLAAGTAPDDDDTPACGWFDSSWALRQGLAVSELPDSDGIVAALWFEELGPVNRRSARLQ